ncbi:het domain-containing protein [Podospora aff. communis PSN243]|uniref:Het domain-containing protein n=1 Tax=Podospora aff. communis PSN243 TaxID=3040156 RepID=A0AAV9GG35_9PEZI|nr:het domain-containing protein [Podospora aff. communis PSN243]
MVCTICGDFVGKGELQDASSSSELLESSRDWKVLDLTWQDLLVSAKTCYICEIIVRGSRRCFDQHHVKEMDIAKVGIHFYYQNRFDVEGQHDPEKQICFQLKDGTRFEVEMFATEDEECVVPDAWESIPTFFRTTPSTDSDAALDKAKEWIEECLRPDDAWECGSDEDSETTQAHEFCNSPANPLLPSRVVDVGLDTGVVRLVETKGQSGLYICLSHCWGKAQIITTTGSTLADRLTSIPLDLLSNTFRDAVLFTRRLGIRYIWIDSLCIIQDSRLDWEIESAKMSDIYSNAHLTIAATHAHSGLGGMFHGTPDIHITGTTPAGEPYMLYFRERIDHHLEAIPVPGDTGHATIDHYPLLTRGWVYQERMLSTRVLHFGYHELWFECRSYLNCECYRIQYGSAANNPTPVTKRLHADALDSVIPGREWHVVMRYYIARLWRTMVSAYVSLGLTQYSDRLPAMAGLAKHMAARRKSRYFAGLWEDALSDDLLWSVCMDVKEKKGRPGGRTAPTWSWASVQTHVLYTDEIIYFTNASYTEGTRDPESFEHFATVEGCSVTPAAVDEFGGIKEGVLRVRGLLVEGILASEEAVLLAEVESFPFFADYALHEPGPDQVLPGAKVLCMRMSRLESSGRQFFVWLVLRPCAERGHGDNAFERIGSIRLRAETSGEKCKDPLTSVYGFGSEETITVV